MSSGLQSPANMVDRAPPEFFHEIQKRATDRWKQLDADPELAGPWRQLFSQVQSPRHVVSELLQNADDAGAREVRVGIVDGVFTFEHDGADFSDGDFASLCRFGFSNKRSLHTIGFRGIGFKSTFSLGNAVEVLTPSLAVRFERDRFTLPTWMDRAPSTDCTTIRVAIQDRDREAEVRRNLEEWSVSTASLLFFRSIAVLRIGDQVIAVKSVGPGPIPESEWLQLVGTEEHRVLRLRSALEPFPEDSVAEIRSERNAEGMTFPPCRVEVILGLPDKQRIYVVLPTGVRPSVPFSCNGPFLQDPARFAIRDPAISPTNRWLLGRVGELAATAMLAWLADESLPIEDRAAAYQLLPPPPKADAELEGVCAAAMAQPFRLMSSQCAVLLASNGAVARVKECFAPPRALYSVWTPTQLVEIFGWSGLGLLSEHVTEKSRALLAAWDWMKPLSDQEAVARLIKGDAPPRPQSWNEMRRLWEFVGAAVRNASSLREVKIVPVERSDRLHAATSVVRLAAGRSLARDEDAEFLSELVHAVHRDWLAFLATEPSDASLRKSLQNAKETLRNLELESFTVWDKVVAIAWKALSARGPLKLVELVRLTQIIAALNARVPDDFRYASRDLGPRTPNDRVIYGAGAALLDLLPAKWAEQHMLHPNYSKEFLGCTRTQWSDWVGSDKSRLFAFAPFVSKASYIAGHRNFEAWLKVRQVAPPRSYPYSNDMMDVEDHEFEPGLWQHWLEMSQADPKIWCRVFRQVEQAGARVWSHRRHAAAKQSGYQYAKEIPCGLIPARWIMQLRELPCLPDTYDNPHQPAELLMRTPDTESLLGVEPFVQAELDVETTKPLLKLLGVRDTPTGVDKLLERIRAFSSLQTPKEYLQEIMKWYGTLDRVLPRCSTADLETARKAFESDRLILTDSFEWASSEEAFQQADDFDVPVIHAGVRHLSLWPRIGVPDRPTMDRVLAWLQQLETGKPLEGATAKRVQAILSRSPQQVWNVCRHWITAENTWAGVETIRYRVTMRSLARTSDLFPGIKQQTGAMQMLSADICDQPPFSEIPDLRTAMELRPTEIDADGLAVVPKPWLSAFADGLARVVLDDRDSTTQIRAAAARLARTQWQPCRAIHVSPFLNGVPAGTSRAADALWREQTLFVRQGKLAAIFNPVVDELARSFANDRITEAIAACIERDAEFVQDYFEEHFELDSASPVSAEVQLGTLAVNNDRANSAEPVRGAEPSSPDAEVDVTHQDDEPRTTDATEVKGLDVERDDPPGNGQPHKPRAARQEPALIERFASENGYRWSHEKNDYRHANGSVLMRCSGTFHWEAYGPDGSLLQRYWLAEKRFDCRGVEIPSELWELVGKFPELSSLVLLGEADGPLLLRGQQLCEMRQLGQVILFPATYRIRPADAC